MWAGPLNQKQGWSQQKRCGSHPLRGRMLVKLLLNVLLLPVNIVLLVPRLVLMLTIMPKMKVWTTA